MRASRRPHTLRLEPLEDRCVPSAGIAPGRARLGVAVGQEVAREILAWRSSDGSAAQVSYVPGSGPGVWQPTPPAFLPAAAPQWANVTPFGIPGGSAFRPGPPPAL